MKLRTLMWGTALAGAAVAIGGVAIRTPRGATADADAFRTLNAGHGAEADRFFFGITELGSMYASGAGAGALFLFGRRRAAVRALAAAGATWLVGQAAKKAIDRPRPYEDDPSDVRLMIAEPRGTSWPSSHPAVLTTFTRVAANELGLGAASRTALAALDASVAASRVYLGVHYPSDVISGLLLGRAVARLWPWRAEE